MEKSNLHVILASSSPRRFELLSHLKIPFVVKTCHSEEFSNETEPDRLAQDLAIQKGRAVLLNSEIKDHLSTLIISADTVVSFEGAVFGKPNDLNEAKKTLQLLSGKTHSVFTGVCGIFKVNGNIFQYSFVDESRVTFDEISDQLLDKYLSTGDSLDKAGAYGIQGPSLTFISKLEGSYSNVVGFPLSRFIEETRMFIRLNFPEERQWIGLF
jgi:septum formation protein